MINAGLVLEGGGTRGLYSAGVLDFFMDKGLEFANAYGVSMGACNLCSYISGQRGRTLAVTVDYMNDPNYCGVRSLLKTGDLFNAKMAYEDVPLRLNPFDFEHALSYPGNSYAVITNVETGRAEYPLINDLKNALTYVQASASMPMVSRIVRIDDGKYLDGGIADSIPIMKSLHDGNKKNVVIMTKEAGYIRKPFSMMAGAKVLYRKYPYMLHDLAVRHTRYNRIVAFLEKEHARGNLFLIRPSVDIGVGRVEKDVEKITELYEQGYHEAENCYEDMMRYLEK